MAQTVYGHLTGDFGGLRLPITYSDNMVLQCDKPLRIAGQANANEAVTVKVDGQKAKAVAAADGGWTVTLSPLKAGGPYTVEISAASGKKTYKNVLAGEVWLCSGQSNMSFRVDQSVKEEVETALRQAATSPQIRLFNMQPRWYTNDVEWEASVLDSLNRLQYYTDTQWTECDEQTVKGFSAVAYAFGKMLADSLGVPVGLIHNAVGGAPTEAWIDRKTIEFDFPDILYNWAKNDFVQEWVRGRGAKNIAKSTQCRHGGLYGSRRLAQCPSAAEAGGGRAVGLVGLEPHLWPWLRTVRAVVLHGSNRGPCGIRLVRLCGGIAQCRWRGLAHLRGSRGGRSLRACPGRDRGKPGKGME